MLSSLLAIFGFVNRRAAPASELGCNRAGDCPMVLETTDLVDGERVEVWLCRRCGAEQRRVPVRPRAARADRDRPGDP